MPLWSLTILKYVYATSRLKCASGGDSENAVRKNLVWLKFGSEVSIVVKYKNCKILLLCWVM